MTIGRLCDLKKRRLSVCKCNAESARLPQEFDGFRIVHLSDLHSKCYGENDAELVRVCAALKPDMIAFTGDLFSRSSDMEKILSRLPLMKALGKLAPVYYIWGNHEADIKDKALLMNDRLRELGITVLMNDKARIVRGNAQIEIAGLALPSRFYRSPDGSYRKLPDVTEKIIEHLLGKNDRRSFSLLLAHNPLPFPSYAEWGADLTLSGHIHGGMIRAFGIGLLSPERKFFPRYTKGLYRLSKSGSQMVVSPGLGKFRLNNPETVMLCVLNKR
ncbi:MAG: metallophosphoesterase [Ruminococcus sp.]|nr:metallophosphoesterase [Ruminococcus sp.]